MLGRDSPGCVTEAAEESVTLQTLGNCVFPPEVRPGRRFASSSGLFSSFSLLSWWPLGLLVPSGSECCCVWTLSVRDETVSSHVFDLYHKAAASRTSILFALV